MSKKQVTQGCDPASLSISNDPFIGRVMKQGSKYDAIFSQLKIGQRLVCDSDGAARLSSQLRKWLEQRGHKNPVVRSVAVYHDGKGGVWWLEAEGASKSRKPQTSWVPVRKVA